MSSSSLPSSLPSLAEFAADSSLLLEYVVGKMSTLRMGPVSIPLLGSARVSAQSEMLLALRVPRIEEQLSQFPIINPSWCDLSEMCLDGSLLDADPQCLGIIWPGQTLSAVLMNESKQLKNASVVIEGDALAVVHWGSSCGRDCPDCRWRTSCRHEECERSPEIAERCEGRREAGQSFLDKIAHDSPIVKSWSVPRLSR